MNNAQLIASLPTSAREWSLGTRHTNTVPRLSLARPAAAQTPHPMVLVEPVVVIRRSVALGPAGPGCGRFEEARPEAAQRMVQHGQAGADDAHVLLDHLEHVARGERVFVGAGGDAFDEVGGGEDAEDEDAGG